jgi:arylsulfatase A-like enzyme
MITHLNRLATLVVLLLSICGGFANAADKKKPNVILIITDDQGYGDIGALGNKIIKTPQMDKLHDEGIRLTNYHAGTTCAPSRSGLMTGAEGNRAGVWHTIGGCSLMREKFTIMPQVFKQNGYKTAMFGKWHLGDQYPYRPEDRGFDETIVHGAGGVGQTPDYWNNDYFDDTYFHNGTPKQYKGYCTDVFFSEAIDYIESKKNEPFFVYLSTNAPHGPYNVPKKYYDLYKDEPLLNEKQKAYYGMITNIDDNIALLEKKLEKLGIKDNTILIFTTDNGAAYHTIKDGKSKYVYNAGMSGYKGSPYEGGHRVPFFIRWKDGEIVGGHDINQLTMNFDILPTLINLCKLNNHPNTGRDGRSLTPLLKREVTDWPHRYSVVDNNRLQQPEKWRSSAVMDDTWRLINGKKLYNLSNDPAQKKDISKEHSKKVKAMREAYENWWSYTSRDFGHYEAYKIGVPHIEEHTLTAHDLHTFSPVTWDQSYIRDPYSDKKPALGTGYWMIDVQQEGDYEICLRRWPKEASLKFSDTVEQLGVESPWREIKPAGIKLDITKAIINIEGIHQEKNVNLSQKEINFTAYLSEGRQHFEATFIDKAQTEFSAFYVYIKKTK